MYVFTLLNQVQTLGNQKFGTEFFEKIIDHTNSFIYTSVSATKFIKRLTFGNVSFLLFLVFAISRI